jgi:RNA polymerase sigma factor (sigma-70 family)
MNTKRQIQASLSSGECTSPPRLTPEQEQELIKRAHAGEDVRNQVILSLQRRVSTLAAKYARPDEQEEYCDLVNSANVALLKQYTRALKSPNPYAYLWRVAQSTMINFYHGYGEHTQRERVSLLSLDESHNEDGVALIDLLSSEQNVGPSSSLNDATSTLLHQAIAALPEKQRIVIERHYGFGQTPQSLNTLKKGLSSKYHHGKALAALRASLVEQFPEYAEGSAQ